MTFIKNIFLFLSEVKQRQEEAKREKELEDEKKNRDFEELFKL